MQMRSTHSKRTFRRRKNENKEKTLSVNANISANMFMELVAKKGVIVLRLNDYRLWTKHFRAEILGMNG